MISSVL